MVVALCCFYRLKNSKKDTFKLIMQTEFIDFTPKIKVCKPIFDQTAVPDTCLKISVIVPARNEYRNIRKTLDALRLQTDTDGNPLNPQIYEVLLLVNNCSDQTFKIAENYQKKYPEFQLHLAEAWLPPSKANIGYVRRLLMDEAYRRLTYHGNYKGIIASTDSDTQVDTHWVTNIIKEIANGCDAVGGRILTRSSNNVSRLYHLRDVTYRSLLSRIESIIDPEEHDPWPRHFQYFGASMAVTCTTYMQVGRLPQVPYLEDNAFHQALLRMDIRVRKSPEVKAYTSTRLSGRVAVGFSEQLKKWSDYEKSGHTQDVEPIAAWITKFKCRRMLRECREAYLNGGLYNQQLVNTAAQELCINPDWLHKELTDSLYFGQLWEKVRKKLNNPRWAAKWKLVYITQAITELRSFVNNYTPETK